MSGVSTRTGWTMSTRAVSQVCLQTDSDSLTHWAQQAPEEEVLAYCEAIFRQKLQGCRVVRFTNAASGYPCVRFEGWFLPEERGQPPAQPLARKALRRSKAVSALTHSAGIKG